MNHLTNEEEFRLTGTLSSDKIEKLLNFAGLEDSVWSCISGLSDVQSSFPSEDFLHGIERRLTELAKKLRGENKEILLGVIDDLADVISSTNSATENGVDLLNSTITDLEILQESF